VAGHELGRREEAAPFRGVRIVAMAMRRDRKAPREVGEPDVPAGVTLGEHQRHETEVEFHGNTGSAAVAERGLHAEEVEHIVPRAADGVVAAVQGE